MPETDKFSRKLITKVNLLRKCSSAELFAAAIALDLILVVDQ